MTRPLQLLIAATCVAVLSAAAYFVWTDYEQRELAARTERCERQARALGADLARIAGRAGPSRDWLDHQAATCVKYRLR